MCACLSGLSACGGADSEPNVVVPPKNVVIGFTDASPLALSPLDEVELVVRLETPMAQLTVHFALLGDSRDASLSESSAGSSAKGLASIHLRAPSSATSFRVRASIDDGTQVELDVVVTGAAPIATLAISASYLGIRKATTWTAAPYVGETCKELPLGLDDSSGARDSETLPLALPVPVVTTLAVVLHADGRIRGCVDVTALQAGEHRAVEVTLSDVPADERAFPLDLALSFSSNEDAWASLIDAWRARYLAAALGDASDDGGLVLGAMASVMSETQATKFAQAREDGDWDFVLDGLYPLGGPGEVLDAWSSLGAATLAMGPSKIDAAMRFAQAPEGQTLVSTKLLLGLPFDSTAAPVAFSWSIDAGDTVFLGGTLSFAPTSVLSTYTESAAIASTTGANSAKDALDAVVGCSSLATALAGPGGSVFEGCGTSCFTALCQSGLATILARARTSDIDTATLAILKISTSGAATLDEKARVSGFSGTWLGGFVDPAASASGIGEVQVTGDLDATKALTFPGP